MSMESFGEYDRTLAVLPKTLETLADFGDPV